jgi:predicted CoA-binding protein
VSPVFHDEINISGLDVRLTKGENMKRGRSENHIKTQFEDCELPAQNATSDQVRSILGNYKTVAVVGMSRLTEKDSNRVARYLELNGYKILPVNPIAQTIMGKQSYSSLKKIPGKIDIVCIFRPSAEVPGIVDDAIGIGAHVIWMQLGIAHNEAAQKARSAGIVVVMNKCMLVEHANLGGM